jgi:acyl-CoA synthetase (AMP-forming)/AMP-acid ligase II
VIVEVEGLTIGDVFSDAARRYENNALMMVPRDADRDYCSAGWSCSFGEAKSAAMEWAQQLSAGGYGHGHRIGVLLENRPEMMLLKLAFSLLGVSWVPLNPDYRAAEMAYVLSDSEVSLVIALPKHTALVREAIGTLEDDCPCLEWHGDLNNLPAARSLAPVVGPVHPQSEASLLYTSGTTGKPKGCILAHEYELLMGAWYASRGGMLSLREGAERVYNPLPLFHVNAGIFQFYGMLMSGNCLVIPERFSARRWWPEIRETRATGAHYLGVVIPVLMNQAPCKSDRDHELKWGLGAGVEPTLHRAFEERFGFPLIEVWGMTEMCRVLANCHEPRQVDTRAMGRSVADLEVRVVDEEDHDVAIGDAGEMVVRHSAETPRKGAFSGYLNQPAATEQGWRGGWWHTGDTVRQDATGMICFVDRKKNIIRRSGENIAAAEIEAVLQAHPCVRQVAVIAVDDEMRDEEVLAAVVLNYGAGDGDIARELFDYCFQQLAYYKAPGWVVFVDELPVTGTQKVLKHMIFGEGVDPRTLDDARDLRALKKR